MAKKPAKRSAAEDLEELDDEEILEGGLEDGDILDLEAEDVTDDEEDDEEVSEPELVSITVGDKEYQVAPEVAEAISKNRRRPASRTLQDDDDEDLEPQPRRRQRQETDDDDPLAEIENELFTNPRAALQKYGEHVARTVTQQIRGEYAQNQRQQQFWNNFYDKHPDLAGSKALVRTVLSENYKDLQSMPVEDVYDELADLTNKEIGKFTKGKKPRKRMRSETLEGGSRKVTETTKKEDTEEEETGEVTNLSDIIKKRRRAKMSGNRTTVA